MLGHTTIKQTQYYAKILHSKISMDMTALREKSAITAPEPEKECTEIAMERLKQNVVLPKYNYVWHLTLTEPQTNRH